tara:strand:+ start:46 stop:195 length:150 start_codon:yes stop_codon:yes gene_type:complete
METYKIELVLELKDQSEPQKWVFQAIQDLLEEGEIIQSLRYKQIEKTSE